MSAFYYGIIEAGLGFCAKLPFIVLCQSPFVVLGSGTDEFHREFATESSARQFISGARTKSPRATLRLYGHSDGKWHQLDSFSPKVAEADSSASAPRGRPRKLRQPAEPRPARGRSRLAQAGVAVLNAAGEAANSRVAA